MPGRVVCRRCYPQGRRVGAISIGGRQPAKNKNKIKFTCIWNWLRDCVCIRYDVSGAGAPWRWACVGNMLNFVCLYVCMTVGSACTVHDDCLIFFFHFLSEFAKLYFACILTRGLNNSGTLSR